MKSILISVALFATLFVQKSIAQDSTKTQTSQLLISYYTLKDALVGSNAKLAAAAAEDFLKEINSADKQTVNEAIKTDLSKDATYIAKSTDINKQRLSFAKLSSTIYELAKSVKLTADPIYQQYCPMKKTTWLSSSKDIKNPYYGNAMLTCGNVKETF